ncbi:MAG TPA: PP2C family protein-serine/threonine phosphatase [Solirubrobacteraceae bacterium]|nr:PP2C family protein-serine/threonine phosphatase [Solirubrobacteraceae bacterium]
MPARPSRQEQSPERDARHSERSGLRTGRLRRLARGRALTGLLLAAAALNATSALAAPHSAPGEGISSGSPHGAQEAGQSAPASAPHSAPGEGEGAAVAPTPVSQQGAAPAGEAQVAASTPGAGAESRAAAAGEPAGAGSSAPAGHGRASDESTLPTAPSGPSASGSSAAAPSGSASSSGPAPAPPAAPTATQPGTAASTTASSHHAARAGARRRGASAAGASALSGRRSRRVQAHPATLTATAAGPVASAGAAQQRGESAQRDTHQARQPSGLNPIPTVERIVHSVPRPIWLMMAILAALSALLGMRSILANVRARRSERERELLARAVGTLQGALLPAVPESVAGIGTSVAYRPAEGPGAGGDFYDIFALPDGRLGVIVGDVAGHGEEALPKTALLRYTLRTYLDSGLPPRSALAAAAAGLDERLEGAIATALLAVLDARTGLLVYASAGHPPPLIVGAPEIEPLLAAAAPPIGTGVRTGMRQTELQLAPGAQICFYTDGLVEARSRGELLGVTRVREELEALGEAASAPALLERVAALADQRPDDMATCLLTLPGNTAAARASGPLRRTEELEVDRSAAASSRPALFLTAAGLSAERSAEALSALRLVLREASSALLRVSAPAAAGTEVEIFPIAGSIVQLNPGATATWLLDGALAAQPAAALEEGLS